MVTRIRTVVEAVQRQAALGSTYYTLNEPIIELAERIVEAVPCAEEVRFVSTGTEATFHAMRIARTFTGKPKILKFEGGFHGVNDYAMMSAHATRQTSYPTPIPDSAGIPKEVEADVLVSRWNDVELTRSIVEEHAHELAAVICEPLQRSLVPAPGFLAELRDLTRNARRAAHLRRGRDRVSTRLWRRAGALRRGARHRRVR